MSWHQQLPPLSSLVHAGYFYNGAPPIMNGPAPPSSAAGTAGTSGTTAGSNSGTNSSVSTSKRKKKTDKDDEVSYPVNYPVHAVRNAASIDSAQRKLLPQEIKTLRYATGIDERNFITVYEYTIGDQPIIWDYYTGYVHLTGIWKALGNSKADIVRLLDGSPELEQVFRRVRGGFLKIQGTWVPYNVAKSLAVRFCHPIRYALVAVFGADFPELCLEPHELGYGQLQIKQPSSATGKTAPSRRKSAVAAAERTKDATQVQYDRKIRTQSAPQRHKLWDMPNSEDCAIDTSDDESDSLPNSPPPMPRKLSFVDAQQVLSSPPQFLEMLQATRSLQQLSSGSLWPAGGLGGDFEVEGTEKRYVWDGGENLRET